MLNERDYMHGPRPLPTLHHISHLRAMTMMMRNLCHMAPAEAQDLLDKEPLLGDDREGEYVIVKGDKA